VAGFNEGKTRPGGSGISGTSGSVQFKSGSTFAGDDEFNYNPTTDYLSVTGTISASYFYGDGSNLTGVGGGGSPGGSDTYIQFNNNGSFQGVSGLTTDGTGSLTTTGVTSSGGLNAGGNVASGNANLVISVLNTGAAPEGEYSGSIDLVMGDAQAGDAVYFKTFGSASVANIDWQGNLNLDGNIIMDGALLTADNAALQCAWISQINAIHTKAGENLQLTFDSDKDFKIGWLSGSTGIKIFGGGEEVQGSILSSSAGGIDIDLYTGSLKNVTTLSASSNVSASAFYGDGSNLSGISSGQSFDTITATTKTAVINTTYYVTPNASNTTVTLPAAGTAGSTIKFIFDSLTGVDRYCDIGVTSAAAFKTPFSSGATNMRLWKPCDVTFLDNGTEWTAMEGTCYEIQPWFLNETVGSLGHGLVEAVPFGQMSGFGCTGLLMGTGWQQRDHLLSMQTNTFKNESLLDSDNNPLYFGKTYRRETTYRGLLCESREDLVLTGSVQQFFVFVGHTGASYTSDSTAHRYLSNSDGSYGYSFMMYKNGGSDNIFVSVKDSSANVSSFLSDAYTDDTLFQFAWGLDTVSPWYSESGSAPAAMPTNTPAVATDFADIDNPVGTMLCKGLGDWQVGSTRACGAWFYHGRARWSDAEAADFWEIRTSGSAKVFL